MATPKPPRGPNPQSAEWFKALQASKAHAGSGADLEAALPPLKGLPSLKKAGPVPMPTPAPLLLPAEIPSLPGRAVHVPNETPVPVWTEESTFQPLPPSATDPSVAGLQATPLGFLPSVLSEFRGRIGQYQILDLLGEGGMGVVYKAEDVYLKRLVALKVMKPHITQDDTAWKLFLNEAQATAALDSPRIATVYNVGEEIETGTMYLAMELLKGESLESRLQRGNLPLGEALCIVREAALGLAVAHEEGFYHRDIKPANLWLTGVSKDNKGSATFNRVHEAVTGVPAGYSFQGVKLLDFGLVQRAIDGNGQLRRGTVLGTPAYMAPEQAKGELGDARSDLYSLGVLLFRLVAGELPFKGNNALETITALASQKAPALTKYRPNLPPSLVELVAHLLSRDPELRPDHATEVAENIELIEKDLASPPRKPTRPRRRKALAGVLLLLAAACSVGWFTWRDRSDKNANSAAIPASDSAGGIFAPHQVTLRVGERLTVDVLGGSIENASNGMFYIYASDPQLLDEKFRLAIPAGLVKAMMDRGMFRPDTVVGETIRVRGTVTREGNTSEILIHEASQIHKRPKS
jgi:serine/threonine protein kinase